MGKKKSGRGNGGGERGGDVEAEAVVAREFVLRVAMHCRCKGCRDKVRGAVRQLTLAPGVEAADTSAAESSGEVRLLATADPERLRRRLHKATGKKVDLLLPAACNEQGAGGKKGNPLDDAALQALFADLQLQQAVARQQHGGGHGAPAPWAGNQQQQQLMGLGLGGAGTGSYGSAYPWPSSAASSYYPAAPTTGWGAYGYAPPAPALAHSNLGYYGVGGVPSWNGY